MKEIDEHVLQKVMYDANVQNKQLRLELNSKKNEIMIFSKKKDIHKVKLILMGKFLIR